MRNRLIVLSAVVLAAVLAIGFAVVTATGGASSTPDQVAVTRVGVRPVTTDAATGGSPAQDALLRATLARIDAGVVSSAAIGAQPDGGGGSSTDPKASWLYLHALAQDQESSIVSIWESRLVALGFAEQAAKAHLDGVAGYSIDVRDVTGALLTQDEEAIPADLAATPVPAGVATIVSKLKDRATASGGTLRSVKALDVPQRAIEATVEASDAAAFAEAANARIGQIAGDDSGYDSRLLRVIDGSGRTLVLSAFTPVLGQAITWTAPDVKIDTYRG